MYEKNLSSRAGLTPQFEDGVTAYLNMHIWTEEQTPTTPKLPLLLWRRLLVRIEVMRHRWIGVEDDFQCRRLTFLYSNYNQDDAPDDGTRSCPTDAGPSSYYDRGPYDYVSGLGDRFHDVVHAVEQPLWSSCTQSQFGVAAELVDIKVDGHISKQIYDRISQWAYHILPYDHALPLDYYNTKKLVKDLGLPMRRLMRVRMVAYCTRRTTLIWTTVIFMEKLGTSRPGSKILTARRPRMPFLDTCRLTLRCKAESHNVRLGLCTDGFALHGQYDRTYSCGLVILTPYNLPPEMCMSYEYMSLTMVISGPSNVKRLIDVYLEPLIEELQNLWHVGVLTRDSAKNKTFTMCTAVMLTVNHYKKKRDLRPVQERVFFFFVGTIWIRHNKNCTGIWNGSGTAAYPFLEMALQIMWHGSPQTVPSWTGYWNGLRLPLLI
ncbi:UNVERIFIED_CONTAM: hypothetical protein Slati_4229900 [Sesamum latifolium]|uniref:Uncharacterized protein n=1 Tax=Sesamum latifolium TaxID=2727402 RepID=A0AAW2TC46_9LAMI